MAYTTLTTKQHNAVAALLTEPTLKQAAAKAGCGLRTLHTWLDDPTFARAYAAARRSATRRAVARLQQYSDTAAAVLLEIMAVKSNPPGVRVMAAKTVLEMAIKAIEVDDVQQRLADVEARLDEQQRDTAAHGS